MHERSRRAAKHPLRVAAFAFAAFAGAALAGDDTPTLPPAFARMVDRLQAESAFADCVGAALGRAGLDDAAVARRIAAAGLAPQLYGDIANEVDDPEALLEASGFIATSRDPAVIQAEQALVIARQSAVDESRALPALRPLNLWFVAANQATGAGCDVPAHMQPGGDALRAQAEAILPFMQEGERVNECLAAAYETRGINEDAAYALIESKGYAGEFRGRVLALATDPAHRAELAKAVAPAHFGRGLILLSATTFDLASMAKARAVNVIYLDRALGGICAPNDELQTFIGAAKSANH